ncbi:MAG: DUF2207 family protein [Clostridia bacterium]|jgi:membrane protein-like protein
MKKKLNGWIKYIIILVIIFAILGIILCFNIDQIQIMNKLDYNVALNEDGSMNVVETWNVYVKNTGTLFKDFYNTNKYPISDISVKNLKTNEQLEDLGYEEYHVPEGKYYAEEIKNNVVEVAFGTGKKKSSGNVKFQISYKINNVINSYEDCQEFYWKFLDKSNGMMCKNISGTITLPRNLSNSENLLVWGHGNINGRIDKSGTNKVKFKIKNFSAGNMLEIRVVTKEKMFNVEGKTFTMLNGIQKEETRWASKTNENIKENRIILIIILSIEVIILLFIFKDIKTYFNINKSGNKIEKRNLEYFRDIPREETSTPGEGAFLYYFDNNFNWTDGKQSDVLAANILNLCLKGYISFEKKLEDKIYISILKGKEDLKEDEKEIYNLIKDAIGKKESIEVKELQDFAKKNYDKYSAHVRSMVKHIKENLYSENIIDKKQEKLYDKTYSPTPTIFAGIFMAIIIFILMSLLPIIDVGYLAAFGISIRNNLLEIILVLVPIIALLIILEQNRKKARGNLYKLTQKGEDEQAEWKGLSKYLKHYSLLNERGVFDIIIWEKYLVYATAFGISEKVIEELHASYPYVFTEEYWQEERPTKGIIDMACNPSYYNKECSFIGFTNEIQTSYNTMQTTMKEYTSTHSSAHYSSSSFGGGGGFSSGGGGRRRRTVQWADAKNKTGIKGQS